MPFPTTIVIGLRAGVEKDYWRIASSVFHRHKLGTSSVVLGRPSTGGLLASTSSAERDKEQERKNVRGDVKRAWGEAGEHNEHREIRTRRIDGRSSLC